MYLKLHLLIDLISHFLCLRDRVFKSSPHAKQIKNSAVMTPPPIHINGKGNREVRTIPIHQLLYFVSGNNLVI